MKSYFKAIHLFQYTTVKILGRVSTFGKFDVSQEKGRLIPL